MDVLIIDNNDSFTHNLEHLLAGAINGARVFVEPYANLASLDLSRPDLIVISPGPGTPEDYPGYDRVLGSCKPVLGICLGMQILNQLYGGETGPLDGCVHGKTDTITLDGNDYTVARYHSLHVTRIGIGLEVLARNQTGIPMCLGSRETSVLGYQFHPESFLTPDQGAFIRYALKYLGLSQ